MQVLLPLPLALHGVVEELPERPVRPLQQLVVQQQRVGRLCRTHSQRYGVGWREDANANLTAVRSHCSRTCVVLGLQVQVVQLVDVTDVHLLLVQLCLIEVLTKTKESGWNDR